MKPVTIEAVAKATGARVVEGNPRVEVTGVAIDSRQVKPGDLFVALVGNRVDGHQFIVDAIAKGATAVLAHKEVALSKEAVLLQVEDTLAGLLDLAAWYRRSFSVTVIGVTGSTGKTTTKELVATALGERFQVLKSSGNYNTEIGVPLTLFQLDGTQDVAVIEMGMRGLGQIRKLAKIAAPDLGIITNIGVTHMELLGTRENIARAKGELLEELPPGGRAILNGDDPHLRSLASAFPGKVFFYGFNQGNDFRAEDISIDEQGVSFSALGPGKRTKVFLPLPGRHNVHNALAALAAGACLDLSLPEMVRALAGFQPVAMRMDLTRRDDGVLIINDAYNANPDSMGSALLTLKELKQGEGRTIAVLGDMLELGTIAPLAHRQVGAMAAELKLDLLVALGDWREETLAGALNGGMAPEQCKAFPTKGGAVIFLRDWLQRGDTLLVKGSRGMELEEVVQELTS